MAITTIYTYPLTGSQREFTVPFEYLARRFVVLTLIGQDRKELVLATDFRFISKTIVQTTVPWGPADGYERIEIRRDTSATDRLVDFADGSILRASELNISQIQTLHVAEEARNMVADTISENADGDLDARGRRLANLADATDPGHAVTLRQEQAWSAGALNQANRAETEARAAAASAAAALGSKNAAATSETNAAAWAAGVNMPSAAGNGGKVLRQRSDGTGLEYIPGYIESGVGRSIDLRDTVYSTGTPQDVLGKGIVSGFASAADLVGLPGGAFDFGTLTVNGSYVDATGVTGMSRVFLTGNRMFYQNADSLTSWGAWSESWTPGNMAHYNTYGLGPAATWFPDGNPNNPNNPCGFYETSDYVGPAHGAPDWYRFINVRHKNPAGYMTQICMPFHLPGNLYFRTAIDGAFGPWSRCVVSSEYQGAGWAYYTRFPNGTIMQWGSTPAIAGDTGTTVTFPIAFPNAGLNLQATAVVSGASIIDNWGMARFISNSQAFIMRGMNGATETNLVYYYATGY